MFRVTQLESGVRVVGSRCLSPWGAPCGLGSSGMVLRGELLVEEGQRKGEGSRAGEKPGRGVKVRTELEEGGRRRAHRGEKLIRWGGIGDPGKAGLSWGM